MVRSPIKLTSLAAVVAVASIAAGCGQGYGRDDAVASFADANPSATEAQAGCVVDRLIDRYGLDQLEAELVADPIDPAFEETQFRDMFACGLEGDLEGEIARQLVDNGVEQADAPCVAGELVDDLEDSDIDVLLSGEITQDFMGKFVDAMRACGAIDS